MTDKENLLAKEDRIDLIYETLSNKLQNTSISKNSDEISIRINSNNPDPTKISIEVTDHVYRVIYWDGYAVNEYYDYKKFIYYKYFVHSFNDTEVNDEEILYSFYYFGRKFVAAIKSNSIIAFQFHPEKSDKTGLKIINNFINL